ncbi:MAG: non-hydrolyzing UDP-N-acetylglucosamine 2-epimerase [Vicinamibacterales bacterium]
MSTARRPLVDIIAGARPNFVKIAPIIAAVRAAEDTGGRLRFRLVHTGQHYDRAMSGEFFEQLGIPEPDVNLGVGSGTQAEQAAGIMVGYERLLLSARSEACLVVGDVTSTMACAIAARKLGIPVAHVEAGLRSGDWTMPEEINRVVTDALTSWFFTTSRTAGEHLQRSGVEQDRIFFVGNTMIDTLYAQLPHLRPPSFWSTLALEPGRYLVVTLHRPSNVDDLSRLLQMLRCVADHSGGLPVVFPVHPRTAKQLQSAAGVPPALHYVEPQGYREFNYLVKHAKGVITDSGGITEEATVLGVPCLTLRTTTERPETVTVGTNELIGTDPAAVPPALGRLLRGEWKQGRIPELWDGHASARIVAVLENVLL